ncbi:MAG: hypothetical protein HDR11_09665 [Lachnospiraceae bacterium]|nr:hypothetical protein [Lachnospiraceae bacterium]
MNVKFLKDSTIFEDCTLIKLKDGVIKLCMKDKPRNPYAGFMAYLNKNCTILIGNYAAYRTKYKAAEDETVLFLSTGEVYKEPPMKKIPELTLEEIAAQEQERKIEELRVQIEGYKARIDTTDYRIIKAYEYSTVGLEVEYDIDALHKERQSYRDAINELEEEIQKIRGKGEAGNERNRSSGKTGSART